MEVQLFDVHGALEAGASPSDIAQYLSKTRGFQYGEAIAAGATDDEIIAHLVGKGLPEQPERTLPGTLQDVAATGAEGINMLADSAVGLANIPTLGRAGKAAQLVGLQEVTDTPQEADALFEQQQRERAGVQAPAWEPPSPYSEAQQWAQNKVDAEDSAGGTVAAMLENPSTIATAFGKNLPVMVGGGILGGGLRKAGSAVAPEIAKKISPELGATLGGAVGEGLSSAGSMAEEVRKGNESGVLTLGEAGLSALSGAGTAAFGVLGGTVARKLGALDPDTWIASGFGKKVMQAAGKEGLPDGYIPEVAKRIMSGIVSEGFLEEGTQSPWEQIIQNVATDKPLFEGVPKAWAEGVVVGGITGAAFNAMPDRKITPPASVLGAGSVADAINGMENELSSPWGPQAPTAGNSTLEENAAARMEQGRAFTGTAPATIGQDQANRLEQERAYNELFGQFDPWGQQAPSPGSSALEENAAERMNLGTGIMGTSPATVDESRANRLEQERFYNGLFGAVGQEEQPPQGQPGPQADLQADQPDMEKVAFTLSAIKEADADSLERMAKAMPQFIKDNPEYKQFAQAFRQEFHARRRALSGQKSPDQVVEAITTQKPIKQEPADNGPVRGTEEGVRADDTGADVAKPEAIGAATESAPDALYQQARQYQAEIGQLPTLGELIDQFGIDVDAADSLRERLTENNTPAASESSAPLGVTSSTPRDQSLFGQSNQPATLHADTASFLKDQEIRKSSPGKVNEPVRRQPGESSSEFLKRRRDELRQRKEWTSKTGAMTMRHFRLHGLDISIENPAGSTRSGVDPDGKRWETPMRDHYGYIKGTVGKDKDHIDLFIPEGFEPADTDIVAVVDQIDPKTGRFDEHKVVIGAADEQSARETYLRNYDKTGKDRIGAVTVMPVKDFKRWLESGDTKKPVGDISGKAERLSFPQKGKTATVEADTAGFLRDQEGRKEYAGRVREPLRKEPGETVDQFMARRREVMRQRKEWTSKTGAMTMQPAPLPVDEAAQLKKEKAAYTERTNAAFAWLQNNENVLALAELKDKQGYIDIADSELAAWLADAKKQADKSGDKILSAAIDLMLADGKTTMPKAFFDKSYKAALAKVKAEAEERAIRRSAQHLEEKIGEKGLSGDAADNFREGWNHAIAGKTRSSLRMNDQITEGYDAARAFLQTDQGKALRKKDQKRKLEGTGAELTRIMDKKRSEIKASDSTKAIVKKIMAATNRADLFKGITGDEATPGAQKLLSELRGYFYTFSDFLTTGRRPLRQTYGEYLGRASAEDKMKAYLDLRVHRYDEGAQKTLEDETREERVELLKRYAEDYTNTIIGITENIRGDNVKDLAISITNGTTDDGLHKDRSPSYSVTDAATHTSKTMKVNVAGAISDQYSFMRQLLAWVDKDGEIYRTGRTVETLLAKENDDSLKRKSGPPLTPPKLDRVTRKGGKDYRKGRNVTTEEFKQTFGFTDVGFGDYVLAGQDQDHLNYSYDAFMELADLLGLPPKAMSIAGRLYFSIGNLGHGKASAHYNQGHPHPKFGTVPVINVTNTRGDGTVSHEWAHAFDLTTRNMAQAFSRVRGALMNSMNWAAIERDVRMMLKGDMFWKGASARTATKQERIDNALQLFDYYRRKQTRTQFFRDALDLDGVKTSTANPYWSNEKEILARSFEAWVSDKLESLGRTNTYLVNPEWVGDGKITKEKGFRGTPYPTGEERKLFNRYFDAMVDSLVYDEKSGEVTVDMDRFQEKAPNPAAENRAKWEELSKTFPQLADEIERDEMARKREERERIETTKAMKVGDIIEPRENVEAVGERLKVTFPATVVWAEESENYYRKIKVLDSIGAEIQVYAYEMRIVTPAEDITTTADLADLPAEATAADSGKLSDADLESIFNDALNEVQESTQEQPDAPTPGTDIASDLKTGDWTREDIQEIRGLVAEGKIILVGDKSLGIPTIHDFPQLGTTHHGFGAFTTKTAEYEAHWDGGGEMSKTVGGRAYTIVDVRRGTIPFYDQQEILDNLGARLGAKKQQSGQEEQQQTTNSPPPSLEKEQNKTVKNLAAEAAKLGVEGIDEALTGLVKLFGGGKSTLMSFPAGFNEETYQQAKPHFSAALKKFQEAGKSLKDLFVYLIQNFGAGIKPYALRFAKDEELTRGLGEKTSASKKVATFVADRLTHGHEITWQELFAKADEAWGGTQAENVYTSRDAYDAMEMGVNLWIRNQNSLSTTVSVERAEKTAERLAKAINLLPTQTKRTKEQIQFQQFSTPPALAYVANWVSKVGPHDVMMEPSAGTGDLAIWSEKAGAKLILNELSSRRAGLLRELFPNASILTEDGLQLNNILPQSVQASVVVMNPPFSSTAGRTNTNDTMNGAKHMEQALKRLAPGGRLVAIVGEGMGASKPSFQKWWKDIKSKYNVRANISINGAEYAKYGTTFDNQIIVIDNTGKTTEDPITVRVDSVAALPKILEAIRNDRQDATALSPSQRTDREDTQGGKDTLGQNETGMDGNNRPDDVDTGAGSGTSTGMGGAGELSGSVRGPGGGGSGSGSTRSGGSSGSGRGSRGGNRSDGGKSGGTEPGGSGGNAPGGTSIGDGTAPGEISVDAVTVEREGELTDSIFEPYKPQRLSIPGAKEHPGPLVQSAAMASVEPPAPTYTPNLPKDVITKGLLSLAQLEAVVYAGQAHSEVLPDGKRRGFFIGDNTGVGKGREISGIIMDNFRHGRKRAVWVSKAAGLLHDARRDFSGIGGDPKLIFPKPNSPNAPITHKEGVLFITYDSLKQAATQRGSNNNRSRLDQVLEWLGEDFDGVIAFDEAHAMGKAIAMRGVRGASKPSQSALTGVKIQDKATNARIVYVSATGATEVENLSYATRLGLWGANTPFANPVGFINSIVTGGVAAMEMVARDMKALGSYIARSLSFDGIEYRTLRADLSALNVKKYDELAKMWQIVLQNLNQALADTGGDKAAGVKKNAMGAFWGAQQRFFNQVLTAMQTPAMIEDAKKQLEAGKSVVVQLTNHYGDQAEREAAKAREAGLDLEELDLTPRQMLEQFLRNAFPTQEYEEQTDDAGNTIMVAVLDSEGRPVHNADAVAARDRLLETLQQISIPGNPIDTILQELGKENVAEITGRKKRYLSVRDGKGGYKVVEEKRGNSASQKEAAEFQEGKRRALIFSGAGATGFSFHADRTAKNQQQRIHYVLQPGWRADTAVQGFGRTHRTNQASTPEYVLVTTDVQAQKRFVSSIARRLDQLGALTKGQRETSGGLFNASDNLESKYGHAALVALFTNMANGYTTMDFDEVTREMGLTNLRGDQGQFLPNNIPEMTKFLNRLLSLTIDRQNEVFGTFFQYLDEIVNRAMEQGTYDSGLQTIKAQSIKKVRDEVVFSDERTGAQSRFVEVDISNPVRFRDFDAAQRWAKSRGDKFAGWFKGPRTKIFGLVDLGERLDKDGRPFRRGEVIGIIDGSKRHVDNVLAITREINGYEKIKDAEAAEAAWEKAIDEAPVTSTERKHMLVGVLMPIWDRIAGNPTIFRMQTDAGEVLLGRTLAGKDLQQTMRNLGVGNNLEGMGAQQFLDQIKGGATAILANGWQITQKRVSGDNRVEIMKPRGAGFNDSEISILTSKGAFHEVISWADRVFIPQGKESVAIFESITKANPVVEIEGGGQQQDESRFSQTTSDSPGSTVAIGKQEIAGQYNQDRVTIVQSESELPKGAKVTVGTTGRVQGAYLPGQDRTFLVADNIAPGEWSSVLHHEGFHRAQATGKFSDVFSDLERMEKMYERGKGPVAAWFKDARAAARVDKGQPQYIEEIGAYAVSQYSESPKVIQRWVDRLVAKLRMFLRQIGVKVNLTPAMLREIAESGLRAKSVDIDQGAVTGEMEPAVAYSQTDPVSLENLEAVTSDMARAAKKGSIKFIKSDKKDSSFLERLLSTPEYYFKKTSAAAGRVLQAALLRRDVRFQKQNEILGDFVSFVQDLRKTDMPAYQEANEYLIDTDQVGGFSIKETEDGWVVMSRDGKKEVSTHPTDKEAQVALVEAEANDLKSQGYSDKAVEAVKMARALTNRAFDVMAEDMRRIIQEAADNGRPNPFIGDGKIDEAGRYGVYAKGKKMPLALFRTEQEAKERLAKIAELVSYSVVSAKGDVKYFSSALKAKKWAARRGGNFEMTKRFANLSVKKRTDEEMRPMTVKEALAQMGDLRGSYFPRIRENGEYVLIARKDGENPFRQNFDLPGVGDDSKLSGLINSMTPIGRKAKELKAQGYDVTISKDTKPTDDVFDATNLITSLDAILQESMGELNKNNSDEVKAAQVVDQIITMQIADIFKARGYLASRMKRLSGDEVWEGYETDMGKALTQYGKNIAAGTAKRDTARAMVLAFTGRDYTWQQYKSEVEKPSWEEYKKIVEDRRIDPGKQKNLFKDVRGFIVDVLRNDEQTDRIVGTLKGLAVHKFLGFRISSAAVNATNMVTGVVGTMSGKTGESLNRSLRRVMAAATAYTKYRSGVGSISDEDRAIFLEITARGWDEAQFDHEAMSELRSKMGDVWNKYEAASMFMFGAVEKANRAMTIFAALKAVRAKHPTMDEKLQWDMAKEISDTSHGTYGKETLPAMARGGDLNRMLRMPLTFTKFTHNYMLNMIDLGFNKKEWKAAAYLLLSPALIAGSGATLAAPLVFALAGALGIGGDDPEEEFYKWSANTFGTDAFARHGLAGLAGVNIKGSLAINMPMPADVSKLKLVDIFGPVGGVVGDVAKGAASLAQGDVAKGVELLLPTAFGSMSKAFREHREGVTTSNYGSVFYGDEPLKADELDAALRFLSFNPSRISGIREKQWNEKEVAAKYQERKTAIYHDIKRDHLHGRGLTPEILKEIKRYNELVDGSGRSDISKITPKSIRTMLKRNAKPQKRELERASAMR